MPRRPNGKRPIIYLDEIDVLQMAFAAIEMAAQPPPLETFGLFFGEAEKKRGHNNYRVHFVQIMQRVRKIAHPLSILCDEKRLARLKKCYALEVIGDFHSHPEDTSRYPSHDDLADVAENAQNGVFAIIVVKRNNAEKKSNPNGVVIRRKTKIICYFGEFETHIHFYTPKNGITTIPRNVSPERLIQRVYPRCFLRKKIHKPKLESKIKIV